MSRLLNDLIADAKKRDPELGARIQRAFDYYRLTRTSGLYFDPHEPETVDLHGRTINKGDLVRILPPRKKPSESKELAGLWQVESLNRATGNGQRATGNGQRATGTVFKLNTDKKETQEIFVDDLVVVAEFHDPIYPGLVSTDKITRGGDKPFHTIINGENYHALEALNFTHKGKVDAIYIDPPYNSGATDWKYNNNYVDANDAYRHSKWLAMMERRLKLARDLLNPTDSALIVTIDEHEYLRLGLLLGQIFPDANIQMVATVIKPGGNVRTNAFTRVDEYIFFVMLGDFAPSRHISDMLRDSDDPDTMTNVNWQGLRRRGGHGSGRQYSPNCFYPLHVCRKTKKLISVGDALGRNEDRTNYTPPDGTFCVWPLDPALVEGRWMITADRLREQLEEGTAALKSANEDNGRGDIQYLAHTDRTLVKQGIIKTAGKHPDGRIKTIPTNMPRRRGKTIWVVKSHDASAHGTALLTKFLEKRKFPYPKSLYAVEDTLRFCVADKPDAVILDFFAGSGTTAHAVMRLNKQDNGKRQCILVTNNEVSFDEQKALRAKGLRPGDADWEKLGICEHVTKPRIRAAITGKTPEGKPIKGDYKFLDEFPIAEGFKENAEFFTLTYESELAISHKKAVGHAEAFSRIASLLWMRAGSQGKRIDEIPKQGWDIADTYAILFDVSSMHDFVSAIKQADSPIGIAYVVTDDDNILNMVTQSLPTKIKTWGLYNQSYLKHFKSLARNNRR